MDVQVLNEIANQARQASLSQVKASASAGTQLKALKGNPVPAPGNPASPPSQDSLELIADPVTPEISSVARAASAYSAAVGDGLNPDELGAIQDLAGKVRTAVSDFLSQPGLEQAGNAAAVVASHPEAVQDLTSRVEQAVVVALNLPEAEVTANAAPSNEEVFEEIPASENSISLERITNGAESNNPVVVASPVLVDLRTGTNTNVENPATVPESPESASGDFRVAPASPELQDTNARRGVENPVNTANVPETSSGDFTVTAASLVLPNVQSDENVPVETPVSHSEAPAVPQTVAANPQEIPVRRTESVPADQPGSSVVVASPEVQNAPATQNPQAAVPLTSTSQAVPNVQTDENVPVESPVRNPETVVAPPQQEPVSGPEKITANSQEVSVTAANHVSIPATPADPGANPAEGPAQNVNLGEVITPPEAVNDQEAFGPSNAQPASDTKPVPVQSNELFAQENTAVNPENIRNVNELVNSVVDNEFTSEAKKIFSEPKVIRTVADLADFILERLREIIATKQQQSASSETGII